RGSLMPASWRQWPIGSPQASTWNRHRPSASGVTSAAYRSRPGSISRILASGWRWPSGPRSTTPAPGTSCPSRNTVALTSKVSPATALAGRRPQSITGSTSLITIRPITPERYPARRGRTPAAPARRLRIGSLCVRAIRTFTIRASLPEPLAPLHDLMLTLRWSWHTGTRELFTALDPAGRERAGHDPIALIGAVPAEPLAALAAQVWLAQVGRVPLLLLDSYVEQNEPGLREVTDRLYGGGSEHRLRQELLLGMGGVRAVRAYCALTGHPQPEVFHTNEGHAGFLGLERIREYAAQGVRFSEAIELCRAGTVFTTHPPVPAGIDRFARDLVEREFGGAATDAALPLDRVLALGAETYPGGDPAVFNMAVMGMRLAQRVNGVSKLHGKVSQEMFAGLWPGFDASEVPIGSITNGVHVATWVAPEILGCGKGDPGGQPGPGPDDGPA